MISSGAWTLFRANALCLVRQLRAVARTNPVLSLLAALAPAVLVAGLALAGSRAATAIAAFADGASTAVVLAVGVVFAIAGFNLQHAASSDRLLDDQIRAAPLSRLELFMGTVGIPFSTCCLVASTLSLALFVPLAHAVGSSPYAPVHLALFEAAIFYAAGAVGEVLKRVTRRRPLALFALPPLVLGWVLSGFATRGGAWPGIALPLGHAVLGPGTVPAAGLTGGLLFLMLVGVGAWAAVAALPGPPEQQPFSRAGRRLRATGTGPGVVTCVALKRMGRNRSMRRHVAFVAFVAGTLSCLTLVLLPDIARIAVGGILVLAALGVAVVPLATYGASQDSGWFWRSAPVSFAAYVLGMVAAGFCGGVLAAVVPATTATLPVFWSGGGLPELGAFAVVVVVTLLAATGAGFLVPCGLDNASEQVLSYAAFGASLAGVLAAASWAGPRLAAFGTPEPLVEAGLVFAVTGLVVAAAFLREHERRKA